MHFLGRNFRLTRRVLADTGGTVISERPATAFDAACPLMSLPRVQGVESDERVLGHAPYRWADPARTAQFSARLSSEPGKKSLLSGEHVSALTKAQ